MAAAGRIDGSTKSTRLRRTVPISCTARKCDAAPCVFTVSALCLSSRGWHGTGTGTAYPVHAHVRFPAGHERFSHCAGAMPSYRVTLQFFTLP